MGRGAGGAQKEDRSQLDKTRGIRKMYHHQQRRGQGQGNYRGRGRGYGGRGRGGRGGRGGWGKSWNDNMLFENMSGFLCTCNINEKDCTREALNLLNEYLRDEDIPIPPTTDAVQPPSTTDTDEAADGGEAEAAAAEKDHDEGEMETDVSHKDGDADGAPPAEVKVNDDEDDIEAALKAEIKELKSDAVRRRFFKVDTGVSNVIFIKAKIKDASVLASRIFEDIIEKQERKSRFLLRMLPVEITCTAHMDQIEGICRIIFPKYFAQNFTSFQIVYKSRYNNNLDRMEVIQLLASLVTQINPLNVVDLTNPKYSIIIEVVKNIVCIAVLKDFVKFKRYNLHEIVPVPDEVEKSGAGTAASADVDAGAKVDEAALDDSKPTQAKSAEDGDGDTKPSDVEVIADLDKNDAAGDAVTAEMETEAKVEDVAATVTADNGEPVPEDAPKTVDTLPMETNDLEPSAEVQQGSEVIAKGETEATAAE